jgi:hypothetical protein
MAPQKKSIQYKSILHFGDLCLTRWRVAMDGGNRHSDVRLGHWIGLRKNLQESPIDGDKKPSI